MEALALHLDVESGTASVWDKLAACFRTVVKHIQQARVQFVEGTPCGVKLEPDMPQPPAFKAKVELGVESEPPAPRATDQARIVFRLERIWAERRRWWSRKHFCMQTAPVANGKPQSSLRNFLLSEFMITVGHANVDVRSFTTSSQGLLS